MKIYIDDDAKNDKNDLSVEFLPIILGVERKEVENNPELISYAILVEKNGLTHICSMIHALYDNKMLTVKYMSWPFIKTLKEFEGLIKIFKGQYDFLLDYDINKLSQFFKTFIEAVDYLCIELVIDNIYSYLTSCPKSLNILLFLSALCPISLNKLELTLTKLLDGDDINLQQWIKYYLDLSQEFMWYNNIYKIFKVLGDIFHCYDSAMESDYSLISVDMSDKFVNRLANLAGPGWIWYQHLDPWPEGLILSGGACATCISERDMSTLEDCEDIDLWIVGPTEEVRKDRFQKSLAFLTKDVKGPIVYSTRYSAVTIIIQGKSNRNIQLIYSDKKHPSSIILSFDLYHVMCYYAGGNIKISPLCNLAIFHHLTGINAETIKSNRLYKLLRYEVEFDEEETTFKSLRNRYKWKDCTNYTELWDMLLTLPIVQASQQKYVRIEEGLNVDRMVFLVRQILQGEIITTDSAELCKEFHFPTFIPSQ